MNSTFFGAKDNDVGVVTYMADVAQIYVLIPPRLRVSYDPNTNSSKKSTHQSQRAAINKDKFLISSMVLFSPFSCLCHSPYTQHSLNLMVNSLLRILLNI